MDNVKLLPENEVTEIEGRAYLNPQIGVDETNAFIDRFRETQRGNTQEISNQTEMLGTDVPSSLGGLTGAGSYFTSRYQTPQTNVVLQNLRAAAQADALNQMLKNEQAMWKKRQQDAYMAQQRRSYNKAYGGGSGSGSGGGNNSNTSSWDGEIDDNPTDGSGGFTSESYLTLDEDDMKTNRKFIVEPGSGNIIAIDNTLSVNDPNYQKIYYKQSDGSYIANDGSKM